MKYYLDTEFDGFGGKLLSIALVREDNEAIYIILDYNVMQARKPWVKENILPIIYHVPSPMPGMVYVVNYHGEINLLLRNYFAGDKEIEIYTDWPDDVKYLCESLITGPGTMISTGDITFHIKRVDAWPNDIPNAVQHNAYWDAVALKVKLTS